MSNRPSCLHFLHKLIVCSLACTTYCCRKKTILLNDPTLDDPCDGRRAMIHERMKYYKCFNECDDRYGRKYSEPSCHEDGAMLLLML